MTVLALAFIPLTLVLVLSLPFDRRRRPLLWESRLWCQIIARSYPTWRVRVSGLENIRPGRHYVIMSNHQSLADILVLSYLPIHFRWVSKRGIFLVPIFGWQMWIFGHLSLKRGSGTSISRFMRRACRTLESGLSILIFPEGTRSRTGELGQFKPGGFQLASETGVAVLPVVIGGTRHALPKNSWIITERSWARMHVCPAVEVERGEGTEAISARVRAAMLEEHARVREEAAESLAGWLRRLGVRDDGPADEPASREPR